MRGPVESKMRGVILAAGFGTRLWPLTEDRTKPAIPFLNRPLISYSVEYLASQGITDIIVNLHHQPESVRRALGDGSSLGANITYSLEEEILGTSGALDRVRSRLEADDFVVINGKIVTDIDLRAVIAEHRKRNAIATLVLMENAKLERFSTVGVNERGLITKFGGFPGAESTGDPPLMFTGIQVLSPRIFEYIPRDRFSHSTTEVYPRAIEVGENVLGHITKGRWFEMSTLRRYLDASVEFASVKGQRLISGTDCRIESGAEVEESVLWDRVTVKSGARVHGSIIGDDVCIPANAVIENAAVIRAELVKEAGAGEIWGENLVVLLG